MIVTAIVAFVVGLVVGQVAVLGALAFFYRAGGLEKEEG